jgi:hypothetical protein
MGFGNGKSKDSKYGPSRLFGSGWECDKGGVIATGSINLTNLRQVLKDYPDEVTSSDKYGKQIRVLLSRAKDKKSSKSPDFFLFLAVDKDNEPARTKEAEDDDVPF